jgi:RHS repeat-associated protein
VNPALRPGRSGSGTRDQDNVAAPINQLTTYNTATNGSYGYDSADNLSQLPDGTTQNFDDAGQLISSIGGGSSTTYGYDSRGNRTSMTAPSTSMGYGYDQANRLTGVTTASTLKTYQYNGDGLQVSSTPPKAVWAPPANVDAARALKGVSCPSSSFCAAVDGSGFAQTFNGSSWSTATDIDGTNALAAVSCPSSSFCVAVDGKGHAQTYNGTSWSTAATVDSTRALKAVSCPSASFCAAVDGTGYALTYNGTSWSSPTNIDGTNAINGVSCPSSSFCAAVDGKGNVLIFNGTSWSAAANKDSTRVLKAVSCPSTSFCMAVDGSGYALSYNGTSWSAATNVDSTRSINAVSCVSASYCQAVDGSGNALTYNGGTWSSAQDIDAARALAAVSCPTTTICAANDGSGYAALYKAPVSLVQLTWDVSGSLPLLLNDGINNYIYGPGGLPIEQVDGAGIPTYLQHDQQSSTRVLTDAAGKVVGTYTYDPYGRAVSHTGSATTALRYDGQYIDTETGLYYLRARFYDPNTAQFITRDPLYAISRSAYGYVDGGPLDGSDPTGLWCALGHNGDGSCRGSGLVQKAAAAVPGGQTLDNALTGVVSFGDKVTFGASRWVRHKIGLGGSVDECSAAYNNQAVDVASVVFMFADGEGEAAAFRYTADQGALIDLAKWAKRAGVPLDDAQTLLKWADEVGLPARGPEIHPNRPVVNFWHIHIGPIGHIPVII